MVESGLRFAFAFLPAGVAVVVGLVLAIQRRKVQPDVATPALWGLGLQLVAIIAGALVNVIPSTIVTGGGDPQTAVTVATVIALVVAALTVVSWVLILTALFRRLPAAAGADAPTTAVPTPPPGFTPEPFADDAPTGRHALLDEHGQQVVAQAGVRLSPQTAGLAAGAGTAGAAGLGAAAAVPEHASDLPTEVVPVVGGRRAADASPDGDSNASLLASGDRESGTVEQPDPGPAGVDEAAVGGTPTGPEPEDTAAPSSPAEVAGPTPASPPVASSAPDLGPAGVDEAAVGGTPTGADEPAAEESDTDLTPVPDAERSVDGVAAAARVDVDEAAVGGTPTTADADPATPPADVQATAPRPSPARPSPRPQPSAPFPAASGSPASGSQPAVAPSSGPQPAAAPSSYPQPVGAPSSGPQPAGAPSSGPQPAAAPSSGPQPAVAPPSGPQPAVAPSTDSPSTDSPASGPQPAATSSAFAAPARPAPRPQPAAPTSTTDGSSPSAGDGEEPVDPPSGSTPASHPGLAGAMRTPRPAPSAGGSDLFTPSAPIPEVADEAVGGAPAEPQDARARQSRSSRAPVAGWFEPVTDGSAEGFGSENRDN